MGSGDSCLLVHLRGRGQAELSGKHRFHGIGPVGRQFDPGEEQVWVSTEQFERLLDAVAGRSDVRLSFDDGNSSDVEIALPRLVERGLTAEFFLLAGMLGERGRVDRDGVVALLEAGMDDRVARVVAPGLAADRRRAGAGRAGRRSRSAREGHRPPRVAGGNSVRFLRPACVAPVAGGGGDARVHQ